MVLAMLLGIAASSHATLIAQYDFSGNANDLSGYGNDGTVNGATLTADRFGNSNSAYFFNGTTDYINVAHSTSLALPTGSAVTITAWAYRTSAGAPLHLVGKRSGCGGGSDFYQLAIGGGAVPSAAVPLNQWMHLAVTVSGSLTKHYVNGASVLTTTASMGSAGTTSLKIGASGGCAPFGGAIDDVSIFSHALTDAEIQTLYTEQSTASVPEPSTLLLIGGGFAGLGLARRKLKGWRER